MYKPDTNNSFKILAKTFAGLEEVLGQELESLGAKNIARAGMKGCIKLLNISYENLQPPQGTGVVIMNPPYGERLKKNGYK